MDLFSGSYIALSYIWDASEDENAIFETYSVKIRSSTRPVMSKIRNVILDRAITYMKYVQCKNLWIDRECIRQDQSLGQEFAIQSMDLVYSRSRFPMALLSVRVKHGLGNVSIIFPTLNFFQKDLKLWQIKHTQYCLSFILLNEAAVSCMIFFICTP